MRIFLCLPVLLLRSILARAIDDEASSNLHQLEKPLYSSSSVDSTKSNLRSDSQNAQDEGAYLVDNFKMPDRLMATSGVTLSRTFDSMEDGLSIDLAFLGATCEEKDDHGRNNCHYNWGDDLAVNITMNTSGSPFTQGDTVKGKFKVDYLVPWKFDCGVCDADCTLTLPIIKQGVTFPSPKCPFATHEMVVPFLIPLGKTSPTLGVPTHFAGHMKVMRKKKIVARISITATVK